MNSSHLAVIVFVFSSCKVKTVILLWTVMCLHAVIDHCEWNIGMSKMAFYKIGLYTVAYILVDLCALLIRCVLVKSIQFTDQKTQTTKRNILTFIFNWLWVNVPSFSLVFIIVGGKVVMSVDVEEPRAMSIWDLRELTFQNVVDNILRPSGIKIGGFPEDLFLNLTEREHDDMMCNIWYDLHLHCSYQHFWVVVTNKQEWGLLCKAFRATFCVCIIIRGVERLIYLTALLTALIF